MFFCVSTVMLSAYNLNLRFVVFVVCRSEARPASCYCSFVLLFMYARTYKKQAKLFERARACVCVLFCIGTRMCLRSCVCVENRSLARSLCFWQIWACFFFCHVLMKIPRTHKPNTVDQVLHWDWWIAWIRTCTRICTGTYFTLLCACICVCCVCMYLCVYIGCVCMCVLLCCVDACVCLCMYVFVCILDVCAYIYWCVVCMHLCV